MDLKTKKEFDALLDKTARVKFNLENLAGLIFSTVQRIPSREAVMQQARLEEQYNWIPDHTLVEMCSDAVEGYAEAMLAGIKRRSARAFSIPVDPKEVQFSTDGKTVRVPFITDILHCRLNNKFWSKFAPTERQLSLWKNIRRIEIAVVNQERCLLVYALPED